MSSNTVVGGGIAGLAAAWELRKAFPDEPVVVLEESERLGGKIRTTDFAGRPVDEGADAFLARVPFAAALAREIGLGDELVSPATGQASLWIGDELKPIPGGHVLGVPTDLDLVAKSGILSDEGLARAREEVDLPGEPLGADDDISIGDLVTRRYGREVHDLLVDPLLGGINAGRSDELSAEVGAAQIVAAARRDASLTRALLAMRGENPPDPTAPVFWAPAGGMQRFVDALAGALADRGVEIRTGVTVTSLGDVESARVVVATPAFAAATLVRPLSEDAADVIADVDYASVVLTTLAYRRSDLAQPLTGSGFLVPRTQGRFLTAGSVFSNKWPALDDPELVIIRASAGRAGDDAAVHLDDGELVERVHAELREALDLRGEPVEVRISRWHRAFPQFRPGHLARVRAAADALAEAAPHVALAGAWVKGVGIPTCISSAQDAVARLAG
ncbi:MAG TPA: protoporphyrinogen oxidase [Acidimicrobiales bacterium]|nr:protoporphyrinogen oxidase [Acidimicrobiales bacterium]